MNGFTLESIGFSLAAVLPLIAISLAAIAVLMVGVNAGDEESEGVGWLALAGIGVTFVVTLGLLGQNAPTFGGSIVMDDFAVFFEIAILIAAALTVLMSLEYVPEDRIAAPEYYSLILFATLGMMIMATAGDLIVIFLGLEMMSIGVYVLAGMNRSDPRSSEASLKYFLLGAFSTGFLLYGIALVYGATGSIKLDAIRSALSGPMLKSPLLLLGLGMMLIGFGFKVAAVPFHMWAPDAYEGAPTPITAFMAVGVKLGAFAGFLRIFLVHLGPASESWTSVLWVLAALTMTVGNLIAIVQTSIKRMLAYSAIAHAGYILVGMAAATSPVAGGAILFYLLGYAFMTLGAFAVVVALARRGEPNEAIADYRGLARRHPALAAGMAIFLLSLTGVPPLVGFMGKFYVFSAALNAGLVGLVIIAVLNSVVSAYYYIYVIVAMYMDEGGAEIVEMERRPGLVATIALAAIGTVLIGVYPQPYMGAATVAFASAFGPSAAHSASAALLR